MGRVEMLYMPLAYVVNAHVGAPIGAGLLVSRDDLVRLVVGMQWVVACSLYDSRGNNKGWSVPGYAMDDYGGDWLQSVAEEVSTQTAVDIVDEWLGVRP